MTVLALVKSLGIPMMLRAIAKFEESNIATIAKTDCAMLRKTFKSRVNIITVVNVQCKFAV